MCSVAIDDQIYFILDLVLQDVANAVKGASVALQCLADDSNFTRESSKRNTIFMDMFVTGAACITLN